MRLFGHWVLDSRVRLFVAEQAAAGVVFLAAAVATGQGGLPAIGLAAASVLVLQGALYLFDLYDLRAGLSEGRFVVAAGLGSVAAAAVWGVVGHQGRGLLLPALAFAAGLLLLLRGLTLSRPRRAVVLGSGDRARALAQVASEVTDECETTGFLPEADATGTAPLPILLGRGSEFARVVRRMKVDLVVCATSGPAPDEALAQARTEGVEVVSAAGFAARYARRLPPELLSAGELAWGEGFFATRASDAALRVLDLAAATVLLVLASPVLLGAMLAVRLDSPGPIFYSQERVGRGGRVYRVTKLRSMRTDAEAAGSPVWATANDDRVTRVGRLLRKTRIDEIPQLFAVLTGDMCLVGPRPERPFFVEQLEAQIPLFGMRAAVKPGVTGWAQINYPYGATVEDARKKLEYDLYWIRHRSVFLYLSIVFHTARTVLTGRGAR